MPTSVVHEKWRETSGGEAYSDTSSAKQCSPAGCVSNRTYRPPRLAPGGIGASIGAATGATTGTLPDGKIDGARITALQSEYMHRLAEDEGYEIVESTSLLSLTATEVLRQDDSIPCRVVVSQLSPGGRDGVGRRGDVHFELGANAEVRGLAQVSVEAP